MARSVPTVVAAVLQLLVRAAAFAVSSKALVISADAWSRTVEDFVNHVVGSF